MVKAKIDSGLNYDRRATRKIDSNTGIFIN